MKSNFVAPLLATLLSATLAGAAFAQLQPPPATEVNIAALALTTVPAKSSTKLAVTTPAFAAGADIPIVNTQYGTNAFPGLL